MTVALKVRSDPVERTELHIVGLHDAEADGMPTLCHHCATPVTPDPTRLGWLVCPVCGPAWKLAVGRTHWIRLSLPPGTEAQWSELAAGLVRMGYEHNLIGMTTRSTTGGSTGGTDDRRD